MNKTSIEWVKNPDGTQGYTWNPITGCLNHIDGMCKGGGFPCYAYRLANGRLRERYLVNMNVAGFEKSGVPPRIYNNPFYPRFWPEKLLEFSELAYKAKGIFVCDMSDLFGIGVPEEWTKLVMDRVKWNFLHRFYLLTKQPQNLIKFSPFPENCWVGQTVTNQDDADRTFNDFAKVEATTKYISLEPLLGNVDITPYLKGWVNTGTIFENPEGVERYDIDGALVNHIDWVIIGALTFRGSISGIYPQLTPMSYGKIDTLQPKLEWVQEIVEACDKAGVKVFLKDNLKPLLIPAFLEAPNKYDFVKLPEGLLRQEMPSGN